MKEIKSKLNAILEAKLAEGTTFKSEIENVLGESTLTESVKTEFTDVVESLIVKFGSDLATDLVEGVELELANEMTMLEESKAEFVAETEKEMNEKTEAFIAKMDEDAETFINEMDENSDNFINEMDKKSEEYMEYVDAHIEEMVAERMVEANDKLDKYIDYVAETFMSENKAEIESEIKENLLESLIGDFRLVFEKHNLELPEAINVVECLEEDLSESEEATDKLVERVNELKGELLNVKQELHFNEATIDLTMTQKERVNSIIDKLELSESEYSERLESICEMVSQSAPKTDDVEITESNNDGRENYQVITEETEVTEEKPTHEHDVNMQAYIAAANQYAK